MYSYSIRESTDADIETIVGVYNSNDKFLVNHLGMKRIDAEFIIREMQEMKTAGFLSCVIIDVRTDSVIGVLDYKPDNTVYLSLMMIDAAYQQKGVGMQVYNQFEESMRQLGKDAIRIDVVNDYIGNVVVFWEKQGFVSQDKVQLSWGEKQSTAVVMVKNLDKQS